MTFLKAVPTVFCAALIGAAISPSVRADDWDRKTVITFSAPVEIPGVHLAGWGVLPTGTYVFKILDSASDRHIVQIFSKDMLTVYATILAIPNYRLKATDKTVVTFRERPAGQPEATRLQCADLEVDLISREARRGPRVLQLSPQEFALLEYLCRNARRVVTRTMILDHVWKMRFDPATNVVDVHIHRLRTKVDDDSEPPLIHTVRGVGYVLKEP